MACKWKEDCPSYSGWCEMDAQDYSSCIPFILSAYENLRHNLVVERLSKAEEKKIDHQADATGETCGYCKYLDRYCSDGYHHCSLTAKEVRSAQKACDAFQHN